MRKTLNEHAMILTPITNGDTLKRLNLIKNNILTKWDEYTKVDQGKNDDDFAANQLKWIFNPLCISAETTNSLYQVYWNGSNIIEIRIANHNANNNNYSNIQLANQPVAQIFEFVFEDADRTLPVQEVPYMAKNKGIAEKRTAKLYINHFERNHLDNQNDMLTIIESMVLLVNNGFYEHPFAMNENVIRISEKQLEKIVSECVSKVLRKI